MLVLSCVQLHGTLRVVMEPLLGDMPLVGALSVFFLKKPVSILTFHPSAPSLIPLWCSHEREPEWLQLHLLNTACVEQVEASE